MQINSGFRSVMPFKAQEETPPVQDRPPPNIRPDEKPPNEHWDDYIPPPEQYPVVTGGEGGSFFLDLNRL